MDLLVENGSGWVEGTARLWRVVPTSWVDPNLVPDALTLALVSSLDVWPADLLEVRLDDRSYAEIVVQSAWPILSVEGTDPATVWPQALREGTGYLARPKGAWFSEAGPALEPLARVETLPLPPLRTSPGEFLAMFSREVPKIVCQHEADRKRARQIGMGLPAEPGFCL